MKLKICFLGLLCLFFRASAQENVDNHISNKKEVGPASLKIGDRVPDVMITGMSGFRLGGLGADSVPLSTFRGKLLILDFWATWCAPCRSMMPVLDSLQRAFAGKVVFLPVTYQSAAIVRPVLAAIGAVKGLELSGVTGDSVLSALFPHTYLPHYVWIDGDGVVRAITEHGEVNGDNIRAVLSGSKMALAEKRDVSIPYDPSRPLLLGGNGGDGGAVVYHSVLSGYVPGLRSGISVSPFDSLRGQRFTARNVPLVWLYRLAYGNGGRWFSASRLKFLSADSGRMSSRLSGAAFLQWMAGDNGYSYELLLPPELCKQGFAMAQEDLRRLFPRYLVSVETLTTACLALVRTSAADKLASRGGDPLVDIGPYSCKIVNSTLSQLVLRLDRQYLQDSGLPLTDQTGYRGNVDISFDAPLSDLRSLNAALAAYGLRFVTRQAPVEMLVFRDNPAFGSAGADFNTNPKP